MNTRDLVELLNEIAVNDLSEGANIVDHPVHMAAIELIGLDVMRADVRRLTDENAKLQSLHDAIVIVNQGLVERVKQAEHLIKHAPISIMQDVGEGFPYDHEKEDAICISAGELLITLQNYLEPWPVTPTELTGEPE